MRGRLTPLLGLATAMSLAACGTKPAEEASPPAGEVAAEPAAGVQRETVEPPAPTMPAPIQQAALQTQPGPRGAQVTLNKVAVTGDVLTVQLTYQRTGEDGYDHPKLDEVSLIDDATSQRIGVLKDNAGKWIASPLDGGGNSVLVDLDKSPVIVWFKFPAPPATSKTVSVNIPGVAPFDGVPVSR